MHIECVPLTISYHLYFPCLSNVWRMLHHRLAGWVQNKGCHFMFTCAFLVFFSCFSSLNLCFYHFHFFFWLSIKFPQQSFNQSKLKIGAKEMSVELCVYMPMEIYSLWYIWHALISEKCIISVNISDIIYFLHAYIFGNTWIYQHFIEQIFYMNFATIQKL